MNFTGSFHPQLHARLPETQRLLAEGGLVLHEAVARVTVHGSRGLAGSPRPDSDVDLGLVVDSAALQAAADPEALLNGVLATTLNAWCGAVELDLAAVFDRCRCGLGCLKTENFDFAACPSTAGCLGVYKIQRGFAGIVDPAGIDCRQMQPALTIWEKDGGGAAAS